jgi:phospholipase/lecithinase/hemolysin
MSVFNNRILTRFFAIIFIILNPLICFAGEGSPYNKIVFFGDSLSDNGNLYSLIFNILPKSPPYFEGRFTNSYVWSDIVAKYFEQNNAIESTNFAVGGETVLFHDPRKGFLPYTLLISVDNYLLRTVFRDRSTTLFIIWIGGNDYLHDVIDAEQLTSEVTERIKYAIERLIGFGWKNFLIVNLPNLSKSPYSHAHGLDQLLTELTNAHNKKLAEVISQVQQTYEDINIRLFDLNEVLSHFWSDPDKFNKKYNINVKHLKKSCWQGGYSLSQSRISEEAVMRDIEQTMQLKSSRKEVLPKDFDAKRLAHYITFSPDLQEAYSVGKRASKGELPSCINPDEYFFWDQIHPPAVVHTVLAQVFIDYMNQYYQPA